VQQRAGSVLSPKQTNDVGLTRAVPSAVQAAALSPPAVGVKAIKKFVVQANAYHCTFMQSMLASRGPEWKAAFRAATYLRPEEIAQCEFVWFKYEFIRGIPAQERQRLPAHILEKLSMRTEEIRQLLDDGAVWPDHSTDEAMQALDMLNAQRTAEEPEQWQPHDPLFNIKRTRLCNMLYYQEPHSHVVGNPPANTPEGVVRQFHQLKPLLHYHHMKYPKGTPIIGCFKDASAVWRKHLLYRIFKRYCDVDPVRRGSIRERMPATFEYDLNDEGSAAGAMQFMTHLMLDGGVVRWLAKSTGGANGNGFFVTKSPEEMVTYVSGQPKKQGGETDFWIIQEFVERMPLLFDGHRFHMKVHALMIASPVGLEIYAYKRQRIQCCSEVFDPEVMHPLSYIGNWGQQRHATNLVQEKFSTLLADTGKVYPQLVPAFHRAKEVIAEAIEAAWLTGREFFDFTVGCYELMGWDFVMEECPDGVWRPLLVEANHRPGFGSERKYMERLIQEAMELVVHPIYGLSKFHKEVHNGEVEAIWDHVKTLVIHPAQPQTAG
jgi:hypothetical protein